MTMSQAQPDRLDRLEVMLESLIQTSENLIQTAQAQQTAVDKLVESQLATDVKFGRLAEQTLQLKRAVDYLLSKDGETG